MVKKRVLSLLISLVAILTMSFMIGGAEVSAATLAKPTVTITKTSATSVKVSWSKVKNAKSYTVYQSTNKSSGFKSVKTTTSSYATISKLTCGKTYYFKVKAVNGKNSSISAVKSIKVVPLQVKGVNFSECSKVAWSKSSGASGYEVYSSKTKTGTYSKVTATTRLYYRNSGLATGAVRYYKVRAYKTVNSKKVYGSFSSIIKGSIKHTPESSWVIVKKPTCNTKGTRVNTCAYCSKQITEVMPADSSLHAYVKTVVPFDSAHCPFTRYTCKQCGDVYDTEAKNHKVASKVTAPTCTEGGYTTTECTRDGCGYSVVSDATEPKGHNYQWVEYENAPVEGYLIKVCSDCKAADTGEIDMTCYIDLTEKTVSIPSLASFGSSSSVEEGVINKLDINPDGISSYEITGEAENLTIDINADKNVEIKLNNATVNNQGMDCFDIKNKSTEVDELGEAVVPKVSISIKDGTENCLKSTISGNAIESSCQLEIKGHGVLNIDTVSTSINCTGKIEIKNATVNITSKNRGIDTKSETKNSAGLIISTDYSNITIKPNATLVINSADDGIRCKNMEITELAEGDVDSVIDITSGSDGIQIEGKKGVTANSGLITINAGKYAFNCKAELINFGANVSRENCHGASGFSKI